MTNFDFLMDTFKEATQLVATQKKVFLPALISVIASVIMGIVAIAYVIGILFSVIKMAIDLNGSQPVESIIPTLVVLFIITFILIILFSLVLLAIQVGSIALIKNLLNHTPCTLKTFFSGIKKYFMPVFGTNVVFSLICSVLLILLFIPIVIVFTLTGILSAGYVSTLLLCMLNAFIGYWIIIAIHDEDSFFKSITKNLRFGKEHLKLMTAIFFINTLLIGSLPRIMGMFLYMTVGTIVIMMLQIYMSTVIMLVYRKKTMKS